MNNLGISWIPKYFFANRSVLTHMYAFCARIVQCFNANRLLNNNKLVMIDIDWYDPSVNKIFYLNLNGNLISNIALNTFSRFTQLLELFEF
jgi:hypothetical protein